MENVNQLYQALLNRKIDQLKEEAEREKTILLHKLASLNVLRSSSFIAAPFEIEVKKEGFYQLCNCRI